MRVYLYTLVAGLVLACAASVSEAQFIYRGYGVVPSPYPGNYGFSTYYASPFGYRSMYSAGTYPTPFGYQSYYQYDNRVQPYYTGPYHSVIFDPVANTYRYGPGYANTPNYVYSYPFGY